MPTPTVQSLCRTLGPDLRPAPGFSAPPREITAVHISELLDPTDYLSGGELLLLTGLALPTNKIGCERYVKRLANSGVSAVALGLGPIHQSVPAPFAAACQRHQLTLLTVPTSTPFLKITKAYWAAVSRSTERQLHDVLATQRAIVDAAASPDPVGNVLKRLSRSLDGWCATYSPHGEPDQVQPPSATDEAAAARTDIQRLEGAGVHSSASFSSGHNSVVVVPLAAEDHVIGYLAVGTAAPLDPARHRAVLTASGLLSLDAVRRAEARLAHDQTERCLALLIDEGCIDAARRLAPLVGRAAPPDSVQVLHLSGPDVAQAGAAVRAWCPQALGVLAASTGWFVVPAGAGGLPELDSLLPAATAASLSRPIEVGQVGRVRRHTPELPTGFRSWHEPQPDWDDLLDALSEPLRRTLVAYLRHRGQWEGAARALGVHRNTLRHRMAQIRTSLGRTVDDADTAADLWLALRRRGET